jgi:hypothetical protein
MPPPLQLTEEVATKIIQQIQLGTPRKYAARAAGIDQTTFNRWLRQGASGEEPFASFAARVDEAVATAIARSARQVHAQGRDDWRAAAWYLARTAPDEFGDKIQLKIEEGLNAFIDIAERVLEPTQFTRLCEALASASGAASPRTDDIKDPAVH